MSALVQPVEIVAAGVLTMDRSSIASYFHCSTEEQRTGRPPGSSPAPTAPTSTAPGSGSPWLERRPRPSPTPSSWQSPGQAAAANAKPSSAAPDGERARVGQPSATEPARWIPLPAVCGLLPRPTASGRPPARIPGQPGYPHLLPRRATSRRVRTAFTCLSTSSPGYCLSGCSVTPCPRPLPGPPPGSAPGPRTPASPARAPSSSWRERHRPLEPTAMG